MATLAEIRQQYPQYADLSDEQLAQGLHRKYYADIPYEDFTQKIGLATSASKGPTTRYTNPNRGKSSGALALEGAGHFVGDMGLGARQLMDTVLAKLGNPAAQANLPALEGIADARKLNPAMRTTAGRLGYTGAALVPAVGASFIPGANTVAGAGAVGGVMGLMQPTGEGDSRALNTAGSALAGSAGQGAFNLVGRAAQPVRNALRAAESRAVDLLRSKGVALSVGQQTGSKTAQAVERTLGDIPASSTAMAQQGEKFRDSYTRAVLRTAGENADGATPEVLGRASQRIGGVFDDVASRHSLDISDPAIARQLDVMNDEAARILPANAGMHGMPGDTPIGIQIKRIRALADKNGGKLPGASAQAIKSELDKLAKQPHVSPYAVELRNLLDDALMKAARGTEDFARLKTARAQYRNLQAIADVADTTANGRVSPAALAQRLKSNKHTKNSMRFDRGDVELARLARAGSTVTDRFPQSGTAPRALQQLMLPAAFGTASYAAEGDLGKAAKIAGATWALPKVGGALMTNPAIQNYLASGITQPLARNALMFPSRVGLGAAVPAYLLSQQ